MPTVCYVPKRFGKPSRDKIDQANAIITAYTAQGFKLTLRQLYYQFVARDLIKNTMKEYKNLGKIINDARLAGLVDWHAIEDRTRNLKGLNTWSHPGDIIDSAAYGYREDLWADQDYHVEVWIEKEALAGVFERANLPSVGRRRARRHGRRRSRRGRQHADHERRLRDPIPARTEREGQ